MIDPFSVFNGIQISSVPGGFRARWNVPLNLPHFSGHFPGNPIFPAVGIVDATLHALRIHQQSPSLELTGVSAAKFLSPVLPGLNVTLDFHAQDGAWRCEWKDEHGKTLSILSVTCSAS